LPEEASSLRPLKFFDMSSSPNSASGTDGPVAQVESFTVKPVAKAVADTGRPGRKPLALPTTASASGGGASFTGYRRKRASTPPTRHE